MLGVVATLASLFVGYTVYNVVAGAVFSAERAALGEAHNSATSRHVEAGLLAALIALGISGAISVIGIWVFLRRR